MVLKVNAAKIQAIQIMYDASSVIGVSRHKISQGVITKFNASLEPLDILAVAIAYSREGAKYRKQAIAYYEKYLQNPVPIPFAENRYPKRQLFIMWEIYSDLGKLYEKEYRFDKAIECYEKLIIESMGSNPADYTRIGDVLTKIDVNLCVEYYRNLQSKECYNKYRYCFDIELANALKKQENGYKYKPRNKIISND